jgi:hypothetical protein
VAPRLSLNLCKDQVIVGQLQRHDVAFLAHGGGIALDFDARGPIISLMFCRAGSRRQHLDLAEQGQRIEERPMFRDLPVDHPKPAHRTHVDLLARGFLVRNAPSCVPVNRMRTITRSPWATQSSRSERWSGNAVASRATIALRPATLFGSYACST